MFICPSEALAMVVALGVNFLWGLFNGYIITYPAIPIYWKWFNRISPDTWVIYGVVIDQLGGRTDVTVSGLAVRFAVSPLTLQRAAPPAHTQLPAQT